MIGTHSDPWMFASIYWSVVFYNLFRVLSNEICGLVMNLDIQNTLITWDHMQMVFILTSHNSQNIAKNNQRWGSTIHTEGNIL